MTSVNTQEISHFQKDSAHWWDESGPFAPLHKMNPTRLQFIRDEIISHYEKPTDTLKAAQNLKILDVGCGGGILCEPLARMGAHVTGIDADSQAIKVARNHATEYGLDITYLNEPVESLDPKTHHYDVITALEIIEHVDSPDIFVKNCLNLLKPNGLFFLSTLNRTPQSFLIGKVAAEYIVRAVPMGTHTWAKFLKPHEITHFLDENSASLKSITGIKYNLLEESFKLNSKDLNINYILSAIKKG